VTDYNPDREGHVKHKFYVRSATRQKRDKLTVDGKDMKFNHEGRMMINDEKLAREIQTEYPYDLAVTRVRYPDVADRGHNYFFTVPKMPWHIDEE
jgi:hypothetical protein